MAHPRPGRRLYRGGRNRSPVRAPGQEPLPPPAHLPPGRGQDMLHPRNDQRRARLDRRDPAAHQRLRAPRRRQRHDDGHRGRSPARARPADGGPAAGAVPPPEHQGGAGRQQVRPGPGPGPGTGPLLRGCRPARHRHQRADRRRARSPGKLPGGRDRQPERPVRRGQEHSDQQPAQRGRRDRRDQPAHPAGPEHDPARRALPFRAFQPDGHAGLQSDHPVGRTYGADPAAGLLPRVRSPEGRMPLHALLASGRTRLPRPGGRGRR